MYNFVVLFALNFPKSMTIFHTDIINLGFCLNEVRIIGEFVLLYFSY
jgi:hypothetical protein